MIKKATVVSQRPSAAKKGAYLTILNDGYSELRAYSTRKLKDGEEIVVSVQHGAANDPLAVTILNKKQTENWLATQVPAAPVEPTVDPEVSADAIQSLILSAIDAYIDGYDDVSTDTICCWLKDRATTVKDIAKAIHAEARDKGYAVEGGTKPIIYSIKRDYPKIEVQLSVIADDEIDPRVNISIFEVL